MIIYDVLFMVCKQQSIFDKDLPLKFVEYKMSNRFVIRYTAISIANFSSMYKINVLVNI